jgi:hypothetical protein
MARYLAAADTALRQVMVRQAERPEPRTMRYYAREQRSFTGPMKFSVFNTSPERATFPMLGLQAQPDVRSEKAPMTVGKADPEKRDLEAVGVPAGNYEPLEPKFNQFKAPEAGHYKLRFNAFSVWIGPGKLVKGKPDRWWIPDLDDVSPGRRLEPIIVYSETPPRQLRRLGTFDVSPEPSVKELDVWLLAGETIRPDAARLFRSRPGKRRPAGRRLPLARSRGTDHQRMADGGAPPALRRSAGEERQNRRRTRRGDFGESRRGCGAVAENFHGARLSSVGGGQGSEALSARDRGGVEGGQQFHRCDDLRLHGGAVLAGISLPRGKTRPAG